MKLPLAKVRLPRFQFRLRTFLLACAGCAVCFGLWTGKARRQRETVALIEDLGAAIFYDIEWDGTYSRWPLVPRSARDWIGERLGMDYVADVAWVQFRGNGRGRHLYDPPPPPGQFWSDQFAWARGGTISFIDTEFIVGVPQMIVLTPTPVQRLAQLSQLRVLSLNNIVVTREAAAELKRLTSLRELHIWDTNLSHEAIAELRAALPDCRIEAD